MISSRNSPKLRQPELPASTTVVTPLRKREAIGAHAILARIFAVHAAGEDMHVHVDQAGRHVERGDIDGLRAWEAGMFGSTAAIRPGRWPRRARRKDYFWRR